MNVCDCGLEIVQPKTGRRRTRCEVCSPRQERPDRKAPVLQLAPKTQSEPEKSRRKSLEERTRAELEKVDRLDTWQGVAALQLAELVDAGGYTAQGAAALVKAHREALDVALAGAGGDADVIDMIFGQEA